VGRDTEGEVVVVVATATATAKRANNLRYGIAIDGNGSEHHQSIRVP